MTRYLPVALVAAWILSSAVAAFAQWQPSGPLAPHGHTGPTDGGANITPTGTTTIPVGSTLQVNGTANFAGAMSLNGPVQTNGLSFYVPLGTGTFSTAVTTMTVNLPAGYASYYVVVVGTNTNTGNQAYALRFNNDSTANYQYENSSAQNGAASCTSASSAYLSYGTGSNMQASPGSPFSYTMTITPAPAFFNPATAQVNAVGGFKSIQGSSRDTISVSATYSGTPTSLQIVSLSAGASCTSSTTNPTAGLEGTIAIWGAKP